MLPASNGWRDWGLITLCILVSAPFWQALTHLQNTFLSLAMLTTTVALWHARRALPAGMIAGLLLFKPQLATVVAVALVVTLGWRALAGLAVTGFALLAVSMWTLPGSLSAFVRDVPPLVHHLQFDYAYNWGRQITLHSFWRLLVQGHGRGPTIGAAQALWGMSSLAIAAGLVWAGWRIRTTPQGKSGSERFVPAECQPLPDFAATRASSLPRFLGRCRSVGMTNVADGDRFIAAVLLSMPLLMPYFMDYDLLLLTIPAVLHASARMREVRPARAIDGAITCGWVFLFGMTIVNPILADETRLNGSVLVLTLLSGLSIARCLGRGREVVTIDREGGMPVAAAA
jgi:hypothetical protein